MNSDGFLSFWDHFEDLRRVLIRVILIIACSTVLSFAFHAQLLALLTLPMDAIHESASQVVTQQIIHERVVNQSHTVVVYVVPESVRVIQSIDAELSGSGSYYIAPQGYLETERWSSPSSLVVLGPIDGFRTALNASFWFACVASSTLWLYVLFQFLAPALHTSERRLVVPMASLCITFLLLGLLFAYSITIPLANQFLYAFNLSIGENLWSASLYLDYTVVLLLANALAFELCAVLLLCVHYGVISSRWLQAKRRYIYVGIFVVAALLTPPDVLTQLLLAVPLVIFYEMIVVYARWKALRFTS